MSDGDRLGAWAAETRHQPLRGRNWPRVRILAAITVALLFGGLLLEYWLEFPEVSTISYVGAAATGTIMLMYCYDRRLFMIKPPVE